MDEKSAQSISEIFKALSTKERVIALQSLSQGKISLLDLAKKVDMSRSGFQSVVKDLRNARLIEQTGHRSYYTLSRKGKAILHLINNFKEQIEHDEKKYLQEQLKQSLAKFGAGLSKQEILEILEKANLKDEQTDK